MPVLPYRRLHPGECGQISCTHGFGFVSIATIGFAKEHLGKADHLG
jgi:hypothetical protein